jgi:nicotinamidase-related amidase
MPANDPDLHGNVPETSPVALLLIDVINDLEFEGADELAVTAVPMAHRIADLKCRAKLAGIPAIYCNDNFGRWQSDFKKVVEHWLEDGVRGEEVARILEPDDDDYFVLKPKHSAFFATTLDVLLAYLGARTLILAGIAGNNGILFSANDAYMRDFHLIVPPDCVVSNTDDENRHALEQMQKVLKADITPSESLDLDEILRQSASASREPGRSPSQSSIRPLRRP